MANFNLIDLIGKELTPGRIGQLADSVGETPAATERAAKSAVPAVVGGLLQHGSSEAGASRILDIVRNEGYGKPDAPSWGASMDDPEARRSMSESGTRAMSSLLGSRLEPAVDAMSERTGMKKGSMMGLIGLISPLVLGAIGKHAAENGLGARGLSSFLGGQKSSIVDKLPGPLAGLLGLGGLSGVGGVIGEKMRGPVSRVEEEHTRPQIRGPERAGPQVRGPERPIFARGRDVRIDRDGGREAASRGVRLLFLVIAALAVLFFVLRSVRRSERASNEPSMSSPNANERSIRAPNSQRPAVGGGPHGGQQGAAAAAGAGGLAGLDSYLGSGKGSASQGDNRFMLQGVEFERGSSDIQPQANEQIADLASTLERHPNAHIRIEGYMDANGSKNRELAEARASAVRDDLIRHGVSGDRIEAGGLVDENPVGDNGTAQTPAQNRGMDVVVLSR